MGLCVLHRVSQPAPTQLTNNERKTADLPAHEPGHARQRATNGGRTQHPPKPDERSDGGSHAFQSTFELLVARSDDARAHAQLSAIRALLSSGPPPQRH